MGSEGILKVDWSLPSDECHEYITGSWLKVTDTQGDALITNNQFIPDDCQTRNESSLSIIVHTNSSTGPWEEVVFILLKVVLLTSYIYHHPSHILHVARSFGLVMFFNLPQPRAWRSTYPLG